MSKYFYLMLPEAMACGLPVICTDIPQRVPIVEEHGIVIPKKDGDMVADSLRTLWGDLARMVELGKQGRAYAVENYSLKMMGDMNLLLELDDISETKLQINCLAVEKIMINGDIL